MFGRVVPVLTAAPSAARSAQGRRPILADFDYARLPVPPGAVTRYAAELIREHPGLTESCPEALRVVGKHADRSGVLGVAGGRVCDEKAVTIPESIDELVDAEGRRPDGPPLEPHRRDQNESLEKTRGKHGPAPPPPAERLPHETI